MKIFKKTYFQLLFLVLCAVFSATPAWANLAANTQIINQASLSYFDGAATRTSTASVTVTVSLVPAAPTIIPGPDQTTSYGPGATLTDSFTVTSGSNGPDTYNYCASISGTPTNTSGAGATPTCSTPSSIILGATVTTAGSSTTVIVVPSDGKADNSVNGIEVGDTVVINGQEKQVTAIQDNASGTSTITLNSALSGAPLAGISVFERKVIQATVTPGSISSPGTDVTVSVTGTVTSTTNSSATATSTPAIKNTFTSGVANLAKYVRNTTKPGSGTGTPYVYNSINYYSAGVTAEPGNILEYILVAANSSAGPVTQAVITDTLPTTYVTFKAGAYGSKDVTYVSETNVVTTFAASGGVANYSAPTLTVNVGGNPPPSSGGGTIPGSSRVLVLYQVTVNP